MNKLSMIELHDKVECLRNQALEMVNMAQTEKRMLNTDEDNQFLNLNKEIAEIQAEIESRNKQNINISNNNKMENFSLLRAINAVANNKPLDEGAQEIVNAANAEFRACGLNTSGSIQIPMETRSTIQATVEGNGQEAIATDKLNILEPLRANLVLTNAGANYLSNLRGNVSIPTYSGTSTLWAGEVADAQDGAGTFGSVEFMPKRITSYIDVSRQFLLQDSVSAEQMLKNDIVKSITNKLEATILGAEEGTNNKPAGLFVGATEVSKFDYATIVDMIAQLETNNVSGNFAFIMNPAIKALLKVTSKDSGSGRFICENDMIDGIPVYTTSAAKGIVLGNWDDLIVATWSGLDLLVDNVTLATQGKVRIVVNAYVDVAPRRAESFVCKTV